MVVSENPIRVMIVEDSLVIRRALERILDADPDITVVDTAVNGKEGIDKLSKLELDVIILDIEMPVMDGLTALPRMVDQDKHVKIIMASTLTERNADISIKALNLGATEYLPKPSTSVDINGTDTFKYDLTHKTRTLGRLAQQSRRRAKRAEAQAKSSSRPVETARTSATPTEIKTVAKPMGFNPKYLAIGSSTGGPQAVFEVFKALAPALSVPIVITQHMPATFTKIFAGHIKSHSGYDSLQAEDGMILEAGKVYVAPGDYHMTFEKQGTQVKIKLTQTEPINFCRPAVDVMLNSLIDTVGAKSVLATILTGMGADGESSCDRLVKEGGCVLTQDEATSVVWGMPGAVARAGICHKVLPLGDIGNAIKGFIK